MAARAARKRDDSQSEIMEKLKSGLNLVELKSKNIKELLTIAREFNIEGASSMRKQELIFSLLEAQAQRNGLIYGEGVL